MTQRIFDIENEKDMEDLWDILQEDITRVEPQDKCLVFDITRTNFRIKRKSKRVKEVKWLAIGY